MYRDQPPCNSCAKHDCRACHWTSPLDASYRKFVGATFGVSPLEKGARDVEEAALGSWLRLAARRFIQIFSDSSARPQ
ncbi:hypothetical protein [Caballeronia sp. Lep1P3]|uniref:hypothetical protein n=1 Tax=Caballeronia sp. Lep1P3 TaxID=2878150 RepID=UPI001FD39D69|nr:hypothetical protein [Caballeronia sp. Lep1P3]